MLDQLMGANFFLKIDLRLGKNQVRVRENYISNMDFMTRYGQFEFLVMSFELRNDPTMFIDLMNNIFGLYLGLFVIVFINGILIY